MNDVASQYWLTAAFRRTRGAWRGGLHVDDIAPGLPASTVHLGTGVVRPWTVVDVRRQADGAPTSVLAVAEDDPAAIGVNFFYFFFYDVAPYVLEVLHRQVFAFCDQMKYGTRCRRGICICQRMALVIGARYPHISEVSNDLFDDRLICD